MNCFTLLTICVLLVLEVPRSSPTAQEAELILTRSNFDDEIGKGPQFVMFYAPWCGHCKRLHPTWTQLAQKYNEEQNGDFVTISKVDCTAETQLCADQGVTGYPTLKLFDGGEGIRYRGRREVAAFDAFLAENVRSGDDEEEVEDEDFENRADERSDGELEEDDGEAPTELVDIEDGLAKLNERTFDMHVADGVHFVKFFAPWCGHCQRMAPAWDQLAKALEDDSRISIGRVDCTTERSLCETHGVRGYPSLLVFVNGRREEKYQGSREFQDLFAFISQSAEKFEEAKLRDDLAVPQVPTDDLSFEATISTVAKISEDDFEEARKAPVAFVKFYAPWCSHCQTLAPLWEELADKFSNDENILIAKVDCTENRSLCDRHSVTGYPTLLLFVNGDRADEFTGVRDLESLSAFVESRRQKDEL